jgi:hypothetical protein
MAKTFVPFAAGRSIPSWKSHLRVLMRGPNEVFISFGMELLLSGHM